MAINSLPWQETLPIPQTPPLPREARAVSRQPQKTHHKALASNNRVSENSTKNWLPKVQEFQSHPPGYEHDNTWWDHAFGQLFDEISSFAQRHYGQHDVSRSALSPWAEELEPLFLAWCDDVAIADAEDGGWYPLLHETEQRVHLITAIISRVVFTRVFGHELFGATRGDRVKLARKDFALKDEDGKLNALLDPRTKLILSSFQKNCASLSCRTCGACGE